VRHLVTGDNFQPLIISTLRMDAAWYSKTFTTRFHNPEHLDLNLHRLEKHKHA